MKEFNIKTTDIVTTSKIAVEEYLQHRQPFEAVLNSSTQLSDKGVYVFDLYKHEFLYVSPNISKWYGVDADVVMEDGYALYTKHVPQKDLAMLEEVYTIESEKYESTPEEERQKYSISYDFRFEVNGKYQMINHRTTPLTFNDTKLRLVLCYVSMSISKKPGNLILRNDNKTYSEYNFSTRRWKHKTPSKLTEKDKELILLIARGLTTKEIGEELGKSAETIKSYRRDLLKKLGMHNFNRVLYHYFSFGLFLDGE